MQIDIAQTPFPEDQIVTENGTPITLAQKRFYASEQCTLARDLLEDMVANPKYNTESIYFSGNTLGFVDRHLHHLSTHPNVNLQGYISNLKLMTNTTQR